MIPFLLFDQRPILGCHFSIFVKCGVNSPLYKCEAANSSTWKFFCLAYMLPMNLLAYICSFIQTLGFEDNTRPTFTSLKSDDYVTNSVIISAVNSRALSDCRTGGGGGHQNVCSSFFVNSEAFLHVRGPEK